MTWGQLCGTVCFAVYLLTDGVFFTQQAGRELQTVTSFILLELTLLDIFISQWEDVCCSAAASRAGAYFCLGKLGEYSERCVSLDSVTLVLRGTAFCAETGAAAGPQ